MWVNNLSCGAAAAGRATAARAYGARFASYSLPALPYDVTALEPVCVCVRVFVCVYPEP